ncbi:MAG TPA: Holliday junction resolvase RuvX [Acidimicrobiales bacterium]|nr:Holliday junction resolvase RuvX [Acidimicrobiales bacterium]
MVGLDLGKRRVGVAVSDSGGVMAVPSTTLHRTGDDVRDRRRLAEVVRELEPERVVVGLPRSLDGSDGPAAVWARGEAAALVELLDVPVELYDERLTTVSAQRSLVAAGVKGRDRRRVVDQVAAAVLLQAWLDGGRGLDRGRGRGLDGGLGEGLDGGRGTGTGG